MHYSDNIDDIRKGIIRFAGSPEKARAFVAKLAATDWDAIAQCHSCSSPVGSKNLTIADKLPSYGDTKLCPDCLAFTRDLYKFDCAICENWYMERTFVRGDKNLCETCCLKYSYEIERINNQIQRTLVLGLVSDLTTKQWINTIGHFWEKCVYCPKPVKVMDHFIPVVLGGGTTVSNCVPACAKCNNKKHDTHPDKLDRLFPPDNLTRIRDYLSQQSA